MRPYSIDLRHKVAAVDRGVPRGPVAVTFGGSPSTVKRYSPAAGRITDELLTSYREELA